MPLIHDNIAFHNVTALERSDVSAGLRVQRFPKAVRDRLDWGGAGVSELTSGCELRFVTEAEHVRVVLGSLDQTADVQVYRGELWHSAHRIEAGTTKMLALWAAPQVRIGPREGLTSGIFSPDVWRVILPRFVAVYHGIDVSGKAIRPPQVGETPSVRWLAYGSSITHGNGHDSYIFQAARRLKVDVLGCGLSGSCLAEGVMADFLASRGDWDVITMELGVNMRAGFSVEEFKKRTTYLVDTVLEMNPGKPVVLLTVFPNDANPLGDLGEHTQRQKGYDEHLRTMARVQTKAGRPVHLIEGKDVLTSTAGLSCDLVHPGIFGHVMMGENLALRLKAIVDPLR